MTHRSILGTFGETMKNGVTGAVEAAGSVSEETANAVKKALVSSVKGAKEVLHEL